MEKLIKMINEEIYIPNRNNEKMRIFEVVSYKTELETETIKRVNFLVNSESPYIKELNIKLNVLNKTEKEIVKDFKIKLRETIGENNFLKYSILILRNVLEKTVRVIPFLYEDKKSEIYYKMIIDENNSAIFKGKMSTIDVFKKLNLYDDYKNVVDVYLNFDTKTDLIKKVISKLKNKEKIPFIIIKEIACTDKISDLESYKTLYEIVDKEELPKISLYCRKRLAYIKMLEERDLKKIDLIIGKNIIKSYGENPFVINSPKYVEKILTGRLSYLFEDYMLENIKDNENKIKEFLENKENKIKEVFGRFDLKIYISYFDVLTETYGFLVSSDEKIKEFTANSKTLKEDIVNIIKTMKMEE